MAGERIDGDDGAIHRGNLTQTERLSLGAVARQRLDIDDVAGFDDIGGALHFGTKPVVDARPRPRETGKRYATRISFTQRDLSFVLRRVTGDNRNPPRGHAGPIGRGLQFRGPIALHVELLQRAAPAVPVIVGDEAAAQIAHGDIL